MASKKRKKEIWVTLEQMNEEILPYVKNYRKYYILQNALYPGDNDVCGKIYAYIGQSQTTFCVTFNNGKKTAVSYKFNLVDGIPAKDEVTGRMAWASLTNYCTIDRLVERNPIWKEVAPSSPVTYCNEKYVGKWITAYEYDLNSAYGWAMLQDMPNTKEAPRSGFVQDGEIGFVQRDGHFSAVFEVGKRADFIWPKMKTPFERFVNHWYTIKKNSPKGSVEREKAKGFLVVATGMLKHYNPPLRAAIVSYVGQFMTKLIDENTIKVSTDSLICAKPRTDLDIGTELGQFKLEHNAQEFAILSFGFYQWRDELAHKMGTNEKWMASVDDILKNAVKNINEYRFNPKTFRIEEVKVNEEAMGN